MTARKERRDKFFRLEVDVADALAVAAKERCVSEALLVNYALRDYLPRLVPVAGLTREDQP